ncbi:MAG TPA: glutamine--fructose-6-phosphate transaminase (isomerizing) [Acidimicrobiales bacterium]|nr:glutamine--fructose-6-phosphate transaminase (isomerizing) [Acidimicrobiales bacterium]
MCGIIGVTGSDDALEIILDGLGLLEYRGYDSAGLAVQEASGLWRARAADGTRSLDALRKTADEEAPRSVVAGIGHTRWATHGHPTEGNAHPHLDCSGEVAVVHNGIIENYKALAAGLRERGHILVSATDTEVVAHLVEERLAGGEGLAVAVREALADVRGLYALAVVWSGDPELIVAARRASPLVVGFGRGSAGDEDGGAGLLASDIPALLGRTRKFWVVDDDQVAEIRPGSLRVTTLDGEEVSPQTLNVDWDLEHARKGGFDDYMSKEIHEQSQAVADTLIGRLAADGTTGLDEVRITDEELRAVDKVFVVACGSSYHAGLVAKYSIERWARLPAEIDIASEFRYRDPVLDHRTLVVGVSQSGETVDTLQAMRQARQMGAKLLVLSNVVDSSMAREADGALYTRAGPEIGVAATKTHLSQIAALEVLALHLGQLRGALSRAETQRLLESLTSLPGLIDVAVGRWDDVAEVARKHTATRDFFFLGRHLGLPVSMEGALKLKEIAYVRAEAYPAAELKHGPIALIEPGTVVVGVATRTRLWEKMMSNVAEVRARGATVILVANDGDEETASEADDVLWVPAPEEPLFAPLVDVVPLQLFAYHTARAHGHDVDRPRNLAKTVTVE